MGVSGCGKSTIARILADRLGYRFLEGDDLHSATNVAKMASGAPLNDADRLPWLRAIAREMREPPSREGVVVACSALARRYRDVLRDGEVSTYFVFLDGDSDVLRARVAARHHSFMSASLLDSQLAALEPLGDSEIGVRVNFDQSPETIVDDALEHLGDPSE
ncbi:MAG TPA: gluconokinase [Acidimicrobiales bacterium]|nr:gluconokinase [Acidimicrobiales bacterium]